jgi:hypothetical protein
MGAPHIVTKRRVNPFDGTGRKVPDTVFERRVQPRTGTGS